MTNSAVQTDKTTNIETQTSSCTQGNEFKLAMCLLDILNSVNKADSLPKKCAAITKAFQNHLGVQITQQTLLKEIKTNTLQPTPSPVVSVPLNNKKKQDGGRNS